MSLRQRTVALVRSHPLVPALLAAAVVLAALPLTLATHLGTGGPDVVFDASVSVDVHYDGALLGQQFLQRSGGAVVVSSAYELLVTNITPSSGDVTTVEMRSPNGTVVLGGTPLTMGSNSSVRNATFLVQTTAIAHAGLYELHEIGGVHVGNVFFGPRADLTMSATPPVVQYQPNTSMVMTISAGVPDVLLSGEGIPPNTTTLADGNRTFIAPMPAPGTYVVEGRLDLGGDALPERVGSTSYVVSTGAAQLVQSDLQVPPSGVVGQPVTVHVTVTNNGTAAGNDTLRLLVNNVLRESRSISLPAGASLVANFSFTPTVAGTYHVATTLGNSSLGPVPVTVGPATAPAHVSIGHFSGGMVAPVSAPILLHNASDFGSATVTLTVNASAITVMDVGGGNITGANTTWSYNASTGRVTILVTTVARPGVSGDFVLAYVSLGAVGPAGSTSPLDLDVVELVTSDGVDTPWTVTDGHFRVGLLGDADGDGDVDLDDVLAIADAVVGKRAMASIVAADADVSRDGAVTGRDAMLLRQHLAGTRPTL